MMSELKYLSDYHVIEFEEFMILKTTQNAPLRPISRSSDSSLTGGKNIT
ncbi:MAG: hypothetical protein IPJ51_01905 [Saprospiraceae bacterium]|nr:hypothetical protein [Saprospiraceae bacterium]